MSEFSPGNSPGINAFLAAAETCFTEPGKVEQVRLREHVEHVQGFRRALERDFTLLKQMRPPTPLYRQTEPKLNRQFEEFREGMRLAERFLEEGEPADLALGCQKARDSVDELMRLSSELQREEEGFQAAAQSDAPPIQQLAMMIDAVVRRDMDFQPLQQGLEQFASQIDQVGRDLQEWKKASFDNADLDALIVELEEAVTTLLSCLTDLLMACNGGAYFELDMGRRPFVEAGQRLFVLHARWMAALAPPVTCPKCSHANPGVNRFCEKCQARLLKARPETVTSTVEVKATEQGAGGPEEEPNRLSNVLRVEQAVHGFSEGHTSKKDLDETINWFSERVKASRQALRALKPNDSTPKSELEAVTELYRCFDQGAETFLSAIGLLQQYAANPNAAALQQAMDKLGAGEQLMLEGYRMSADRPAEEAAPVS